MILKDHIDHVLTDIQLKIITIRIAPGHFFFLQDFTFHISSFIIVQSNLDYPDSLGPHEIVWIIKGPDNRKYEY